MDHQEQERDIALAKPGSMGADDLKPEAEQALRGWPVSKRLNKSGEGDDDPSILAPIDLAATVGSF